MFDNLDKMQVGDEFYIKVLDKTLKYKVADINIVLPEETESLIIQEDKDLITLVTCTPKYVNSHRLLVTGSRVEIKEKEEKESLKVENKDILISKNEDIMRWINVEISVISIILIIRHY